MGFRLDFSGVTAAPGKCRVQRGLQSPAHCDNKPWLSSRTMEKWRCTTHRALGVARVIALVAIRVPAPIGFLGPAGKRARSASCLAGRARWVLISPDLAWRAAAVLGHADDQELDFQSGSRVRYAVNRQRLPGWRPSPPPKMSIPWWRCPSARNHSTSNRQTRWSGR